MKTSNSSRIAAPIPKISETELNQLSTNEQDKYLFFCNCEDRITDYDSFLSLMEEIFSRRMELSAAFEGHSNINVWFNAYLGSDEYAQETDESKTNIIKSKEAITSVIERIHEFTSNNCKKV